MEYGDEIPSFATVWQDLVEAITDRTSHGLNAEDPLYSTSDYTDLFFVYADDLERSRFLETLLDDHSPLNHRERVEKLKRRLERFANTSIDISSLIRRAKRLLPITHRWVTDTFTGTGEGVFDLCDSPHDAVVCGLDTPFFVARDCGYTP